MEGSRARLLCVDDNQWVAESIQMIARKEPGLEWAGWLQSSRGLAEAVGERRADIVLLDIDIPGEDSFEALREVVERAPDVRVLMLSGHVRMDYVDRAISEGAWGYVSKNEETSVILEAIKRVVAGDVALSPSVAVELERR